MPRRRRDSTAGLVFHVLNRGAKRSVLFDHANDYEAFESLMTTAVARFSVALFAYCLMPNHWHLVITPHHDGALSRFMHWLTTTHARRWQLNRGQDGQGAVYQGRFKAIPIDSDRHFLWVCRYVERNALRASLVPRAEDWRWSSLRRRMTNSGDLLLTEWPISCPNDWVTQVNIPQTRAELDAFRLAMKKGNPFGDESWRKEVCAKLGMVKPRMRGRPKKAVPQLSSKNDSRPPL